MPFAYAGNPFGSEVVDAVKNYSYLVVVSYTLAASAMPLNVAIIGPGRSKQGTGPYIARTLHQLGASIKGVVSSSLASARLASRQLKNDFGFDCQAYADLDKLLEKHCIDVIAICSPYDSHQQYLYSAIQAGCHVFCEKPLWWPSATVTSEVNVQYITAEAAKLAGLCKTNNVVLQLNVQWPFTLPAYYQIYPQHRPDTASIKTFAMWLSPQSTGRNMIIDAAPHLLSMLYALLGSGRIQNIISGYRSNKLNAVLEIEFDYLHAAGDSKIFLALNSTSIIPKPAAYAINGGRVERRVELPNYLIVLHAPDKRLPIADPLVCSIKNFLCSIQAKSSSDENALIDGMMHLAQIYNAVKIN